MLREKKDELGLRRADAASTATCSSSASSTRPRSPRPRCSNAVSVASLLLTTDALIVDQARAQEEGGRPRRRRRTWTAWADGRHGRHGRRHGLLIRAQRRLHTTHSTNSTQRTHDHGQADPVRRRRAPEDARGHREARQAPCASRSGPAGRNVILQKSFGAPSVTKDGVSVAKEIELEDPFENMGAKLVLEVANKTNDVAGDGTTTATVLAAAIFNEGLKYLATRRQHDRAAQRHRAGGRWPPSSRSQAQSRKVKTREEKASVATISANNDRDDRRAARRRLREGRRRGRHHGRGEHRPRDAARASSRAWSSTRATCRRTSRRTSTKLTRRARGPATSSSTTRRSRTCASSSRCSSGAAQRASPLLDHRRGHRGRGARDARHQPPEGRAERRAPSRRRASATAARPTSATSRS